MTSRRVIPTVASLLIAVFHGAATAPARAAPESDAMHHPWQFVEFLFDYRPHSRYPQHTAVSRIRVEHKLDHTWVTYYAETCVSPVLREPGVERWKRWRVESGAYGPNTTLAWDGVPGGRHVVAGIYVRGGPSVWHVAIPDPVTPLLPPPLRAIGLLHRLSVVSPR